MQNDTDPSTIFRAFFCFNEVFRKAVFQKLPPSDLTKTQHDIMTILHLEGSFNMGGISKRLLLAKEQTTRLVKSLKEKGFVDTRQDPENRRIVIVSMSAEGHAHMERQKMISDELIKQYLDALPAKDRKDLLKCSQKIIDIWQKNGSLPDILS